MRRQITLGRRHPHAARAAARYPASVLAYVPANSRIATATRELKLQKALRIVGHRYREVASLSELRTSIETGQFNIVVADLGEVADLERSLGSVISPCRPRAGGVQADQGGNPRRSEAAPIPDHRAQPGSPVSDDDRRGRAHSGARARAKADVAVRWAAPSGQARAAAVLALTPPAACGSCPRGRTVGLASLRRRRQPLADVPVPRLRRAFRRDRCEAARASGRSSRTTASFNSSTG